MRANLARVRPERSTRPRASAWSARSSATSRSASPTSSAPIAREPGPSGYWRRVEGDEHLLTRLLAEGSGLVLVTAHLGNWELGGRLHRLASAAARPTSCVAAEADPGVERFLRGGESPMRFVRRGDPRAMLALVGALRRGEVVALQGDRALGTRGDVMVDFFGAPAAFPLGPFVLARAAGVPLLPAFCLLDAGPSLHGGGRASRSGSRRARRPRRSAGGRASLEAAVRRAPEQWFNFFDVWSAPPAS